MTKEENINYYEKFRFCIEHNRSEIIKNISKFKVNEMFELFAISSYCKMEKNISINNRDKISYILYHYNYILKKTIDLAKELKLSNSLELSNLFTYLLWNGYFSKNQKLVYQLEDRMILSGLLSLDNILGKGVCVNFSEMLKDFLNEAGFNSSTLSAMISSKKVKIDYKPPIKTHSIKPKTGTIIKNKILSPFTNFCGNHAFNLIKENEKLYIYDSTNIMLLELENVNSAKIISGSGKYKLIPYISYSLNFTEKETNALDTLYNTNDFSSPYDKEKYIKTWKQCIEIFEDNKNLLNDYYDCTKENIDIIADKMLTLKK